MRPVGIAMILVLVGPWSAGAQEPTPAATPEEEESFFEDVPAPAPTPIVTPPPEPLIAVLVRSTAGAAVSDAAIEAGLRANGRRVLEGGGVRAYLAFRGDSVALDEAACEAIRKEFGLDRLAVVEARRQPGGAIAIRLRAFDRGGRVTARFFEQRAATVESAIVTAIGGLPPVVPRASLGIGRSPFGPVASPPRSEVDVSEVRNLGITPIAVFQPAPPYPIGARLGNLAGTVILEIVVDGSGQVASVRPIAGEAPFLEPAIATVERWRYEPVLVDGVAIVWKSRVNLKFRLDPTRHRRPARFARSGPPVLGDSGTRAFGAFAGFASGSTSTDLEAEGDSSSEHRDAVLHVFGSAFARDGLELQGRVEIAQAASSPRKSELGLAFGFAYLLRPRSGWLVGPQITAGLSTRSGEERRPGGRFASFDGQGPTGFAGAVARARLGKVMLAAEVGAYYRVFAVDYSGAATATGQAREAGVRAGIGVVWGSPDWP